MSELISTARSLQPTLWALVSTIALTASATAQNGTTGEWQVHGGDAGFTRYSSLKQIDADNVHELEIVWRRAAVDSSFTTKWPDLRYSNQLRSTPIMVNGALYASNGIGLVEAFDPGTGKTIWVQDTTFLGDNTPRGAANRGVGYWASGDNKRIFSIRPPYLIATDASTGRIIDSFGNNGKVDLSYNTETGYSGTSPPLVVKDVVIVGSAMADHPHTKEQHPGDVRAYDVLSGELRWTWSPIPRNGEPGVETWLDDSWEYSGMGNVWTMFSADLELGYVYLPTGAPTNDMYGGHRPGNNLYANSLVCIDAATGERVWHFQTIHHDLWDYDNNVAPILMDITVNGRPIQAVVQLTKQAMAYVFDRVTGEPVWPIVERPVPDSNTPGEWISQTQPFPTKPLPFDRHGITEDDLIDFTDELKAEALQIVKPYILGEIFTPPSIRGNDATDTKGTLQLPGSVGGAEWGGAGFDPETGMLYIPSVTGAFAADLTPGNPDRMNVRFTRGTRAFPDGPRGLPLTKPPYGRITAIDMNTGEHVWMVANGDGPRNHPAIEHLNLPPLGQPGRAMTLLTKTLLFVSEGDPVMVRTPPGAGADAGKKFRAYDKNSGDVIWETEFPAGTNGSPITYMHDNKQHIVIPIGSVDYTGEWVALALP